MKTQSCLLGLALAIMAPTFLLAEPLPLKPHYKSMAAAPAVEGWFFRAISGYPAAITFEPVVLFKNGQYWEAGSETLEGLDAAADKAKHPMAWGTWKKQGKTFLLTSSKGKTTDYELGNGNWFPAFSYTANLKLKPAYEKVSGGDYGNGLNSLSIKKISFIDATHFSEGVNAGVTTGNAAAWKKSGSGGTYQISGHTITFTYKSGKIVKTSFAIGAEGSPARPDTDLIFIGGYAYTSED